MTSWAPIPEPGEIPDGMIHVGWRCVSTDCLMPLSRADQEPRDGEVHLWDANHHGYWVPVYVKLEDLA